MTTPKDIRHSLAKAKGYAQKQDFPAALESIVTTLRDMSRSSLHFQNLRVVEKEINATLQYIAELPPMRPFLDPHGSGTLYTFQYQFGKEGPLITVLREFAKIIREQQQKNLELHARNNRLYELLYKGCENLILGQLGTGASFLQVAAKEYPENPERIFAIAKTLSLYRLYEASAKVFLSCLKHYPKNKDFYAKAIEAFILAKNYGGAELIFQKAFQEFGRHARGLAKLAEVYVLWDKEDEAIELAHEALQLDAREQVAQNILMALHVPLPAIEKADPHFIEHEIFEEDDFEEEYFEEDDLEEDVAIDLTAEYEHDNDTSEEISEENIQEAQDPLQAVVIDVTDDDDIIDLTSDASDDDDDDEIIDLTPIEHTEEKSV